MRGLRASIPASTRRLKAIAAERAETIATTIQSRIHGHCGTLKRLSRNASNAPVNANGSANTECSNLIISSVSSSLRVNFGIPSSLMRTGAIWICLTLLSGCGARDHEFEDIASQTVTLPDGTAIHAEVKADRQSQATGMMYRDSLAKDRGMLFVYGSPQREAYWMHNCKIPLDIIWIEKGGKVVEIAPDAPPCNGPERSCPSYGGNQFADYVLELGGGQAKAHGVEVGKVIRIS